MHATFATLCKNKLIRIYRRFLSLAFISLSILFNFSKSFKHF